MFRARLLLLLVVSLLLAGRGIGQPKFAPKERPKYGATLKTLNEEARAAYKAAREHQLTLEGPIVLYDGDDLTFRFGGYRKVIKPTTGHYHDFKTVGHGALGAHALLMAYGDGKIDAARMFALKRLADALENSRIGIAEVGLSEAQLERQRQILGQCEDLARKAVAAGTVDIAKLTKEFAHLRSLLDANNADAARAQIDGLHTEMQTIEKQLSKDDWNRLVVIIQGSQPPRQHNVAAQYFARLLGEKGEGKRIIYAESLWDENKALSLLAGKRIDALIGAHVFGDDTRMERDLLGEAAKKYLEELFAKK